MKQTYICHARIIDGTGAPAIEAGLMGDFILVKGNPDEDIRAIRNIKAVFKNCSLIRSELPEMQNQYDILREDRNLTGGTFIDWGRKGRF